MMIRCGEAPNIRKNGFEITRILARPLPPSDQSQLGFERGDDARKVLAGVHHALERARHEHERVHLRKVGELRNVDLTHQEQIALFARFVNDPLEVPDHVQVAADAHGADYDAYDLGFFELAHQIEPSRQHARNAPLRLDAELCVLVEAVDLILIERQAYGRQQRALRRSEEQNHVSLSRLLACFEMVAAGDERGLSTHFLSRECGWSSISMSVCIIGLGLFGFGCWWVR
mmetsp:Transcript_5563/g.10238  ORF Transcript_5563/g.10238 Transcript_5563/m.10238 type:complete len:230 (+) Transcript_5563:642-1331(+)